MSKISRVSITGAILAGLASDADSIVLAVAGDNPVISVDGAPAPAAASATPLATVVAKGSPFFDKWSDERVWQPGDRWPNVMEQILKPQWFRNLPDTDPNAPVPTYETGSGSPFSLGHAAPDANREVVIPYRSGQFLIEMPEAGEVYCRIAIPSDTKVSDKPGHIKVAPEPGKDDLVCGASLSNMRGHFFEGQKDGHPAPQFAFLIGEVSDMYSTLYPGANAWLNLNKVNVGSRAMVQIILPA